MISLFRPAAHSPTSELTKRYVVALIAVGLLLLTGQILIELSFQDEIDEVNDVYDAGRLQMLGQAISSTALELTHTQSADQRVPLLTELSDHIERLQRRTRYLRFGDTATERTAEHREKILQVFADIEPSRQAILSSARAILDSLALDPNSDIRSEVGTILSHEPAFTAGLNTVLSLIIAHNREQMEWTRTAQLVLLGVVILIIVLSSVYIFRPAVLKIQKAFSTQLEIQETLRHSEERFSRIFHSAPLSLCITGYDDGVYQVVNEAFEHLTGFNRAELVGRATLFATLGIGRAAGQELKHQLDRHGRVYNAEQTIRTRDGGVRHVLLSMERIMLDGKASIITTIKDNTEQTLASRELRQKEAYFRSLIEHSNDIITVLTAEGTIRYCSISVERILGYQPDKILGRSIFDFINIDDRPTLMGMLEQIRENPSMVLRASDFQVLSSNGTFVHFEAVAANQLDNPAVEGIIVNARDISDRRKTEEDLRLSEEKFSKIFRIAPVASCITDVVDSRYIEVNDTYLELTGYSREELIGRTVDEIGLQPPEARRASRRAVTDFRTLQNFETELITKSGERRHLLTSMEHIDINGRMCVLALITDISRLVQTQEALRRSDQRFTKVFNASPAAISITSLDDGRFVDVNDSFCATTGYSREEIIGATSVELGLIDAMPFRHNLVERMKELGRIEQVESTFRHKRGDLRHYLSSAELIELDGRDHVLSIGLDITDLKKAEELKEHYAQRFATIVQASPAAITITTLKEGRFVEVNDAFCAITGRTRDEMIGRTSLDVHLFDTDFRAALADEFSRKGRIRQRQMTLCHADGSPIEVIASLELLHQNGDDMILSVFIDISELKREEDRRRQLEERFRKVFHASPIPILITTEAEGDIVDVNERYTALSGYSREELIGSNVIDLNLVAYTDSRENLLKAMLNNESLSGLQGSMTTRSGEERTLLVSVERIRLGGVTHLLKMAVDVTDRARAEKALAASELRFRSLFDLAAIGIGMVDLEGNWLLVNRKLCDIMGYTCEEFYSPGFPRLTHPDYLSQDAELVQKLLRREISEFSLEKRYRRKDGTLIWGRVTTSLVHDDTGEPQYFIRVVQDITQQHDDRQALQHSEELFSRVFHTAPLAVFIATADDGRFVDVNDNFGRLTGYTRDELIGRRAGDMNMLVDPNGRAKALALREQHGAVNYRSDIIHRSGERRTVQTSLDLMAVDGVQCVIGIAIDITEQQRAQEALRQSEERFAQIFRASPVAIAVTTPATGRFLDVNPAFERLTEYSREELIGRVASDIGLHLQSEHNDRSVVPGEPVHNLELLFTTRQGNRRTILLSVEPTTIDGVPCRITMALDLTEQKQAVQLLEQQELYFRALIEHASDVVLVLGRGFRVRYATPSSRRLFGRTPEELTATGDLSFIHSDDLARVEHTLLATLRTTAGIRTVDSVRVIRNDGSVRLFDLTVTDLTETPIVEGLVVNCRDVTERVTAERELTETTLRLRATFEEAAVGIAHVGSEGTWLRVNKKLCEITGYSREELLTRTFQEITHPDDLERDLQLSYQLAAGEIPSYALEKRYVRKDGSHVWVNLLVSAIRDDQGAFRFFIAFVEDITARKQAEAALSESETRFHTMADSAPVMIRMSGADKRCTFLNKVWLEFTGRSLEQELGNGWTGRIHPDDLEHCMDIYTSSFDARRPFSMEYRLLRHDNTYRWLLDNGVPLHRPDGTFTGYISSCVDITDLKQASTDLERATQTAEAERRIQNLFLSNLGREIRTPLHGIVGSAYLLGQEITSPEHRMYANMIHTSARFLMTTLNNIVVLAQLETGTYESTPSEVILQNEVLAALDTVRHDAQERDLQIRYESSDDRIVLHTHQRLLAGILENLLQNAVKFTQQGSISVRVDRERQNDTTYGVVEISDTGIGISSEFLPYVFDDYTQEIQGAHDNFAGIGLGLTVVKRAAEFMNATVQVRSTRHKGSVFTVRIPTSEPRSDAV